MRRFKLIRPREPGKPETEAVAEGVQFSDGTVALRWATAYQSTAVYATIDDLRGHNRDSVWWIDDDPTWAPREAWAPA